MQQLLGRRAWFVSGAEDLEGLTRPLLESMEAVAHRESTCLTHIDAYAGQQPNLLACNVQAMQIPKGLTVPWHDSLCNRALETIAGGAAHAVRCTAQAIVGADCVHRSRWVQGHQQSLQAPGWRRLPGPYSPVISSPATAATNSW